MDEAVKASVALTEYRHTLDPAVSMLGEKWILRTDRSVASVRRFVRDTAADWNAAEDVPEIAELLVSELVTNAMTHGTSPVPPAFPIRVTVGREKELMTVDVYDSCTAIPRMRRTSPMEISGRGLSIVQDLAHDWGWTLNPFGKSVWFQPAAWP
ncbi:ATP-binding protein [Streptosporangium sp. NPDC051023]|uniref:ATP-binding protein n=1 Tax=Streptosporangium sp. NPDC051023 TaxID=3155410 RepID=UPI00344C1139